MVEGSCCCGKVRLSVSQEPKFVAACHCTRCRKLGATPFAMVTAESFVAPPHANEETEERAAELNRLQPRGRLLLEIEGVPQVFGATKNPGVRVVAR